MSKQHRFAGHPLPQWSSSLRISRAICFNLIRRAGTPCGGHVCPFHIGYDPRFIQRETSEVPYIPAGSCSQDYTDSLISYRDLIMGYTGPFLTGPGSLFRRTSWD